MQNSSCRILIVEDEAMIAFMLEDILKELGYTPVGPASDIAGALKLIEAGEVDAALLDININGEWSFDLADLLLRLGKPMIFVTGYGWKEVFAQYADVPVIAKPFLVKDISAAIRQMLGHDARPVAPAFNTATKLAANLHAKDGAGTIGRV